MYRKFMFSLFVFIITLNTCIQAQEARIDMDVIAENATLKGTLLTPNSSKALPVVVVIPGSGKQTRQDIEGMVQALFSGMDIACFVYDKRGLGESTGTYIAAVAETSIPVFEQRYKDVSAIVNTLKKHPAVNANKIGLIGSSQGSWITTMVASKDPQMAFTICVSGAASSVGVSDYFDSIAETEPSIDSAIRKLKDYNGVQGFDPYISMTQMNAPGLWIYGGQDKSNPTAHDIEIINNIKKQYNKPFTVHLYPNYNHEFIDVTTGAFGNQFIPDLRQWLSTVLEK